MYTNVILSTCIALNFVNIAACFSEHSKGLHEKLVVLSYKVLKEIMSENDKTIIDLGSCNIS